MKKIILMCVAIITMSITVYAGNPGMMKACTGCHGNNFEKKALGASKVVKDMTEEEIALAIQGYKDGTYGGKMKGVMIGQAKKIPDSKRAAAHIYMVAHGNAKDWKYSGGKPTPEMFKKKKEKCMTKLDNINNCAVKADTPEKMKECKKMIMSLAKHIEETGKK